MSRLLPRRTAIAIISRASRDLTSPAASPFLEPAIAARLEPVIAARQCAAVVRWAAVRRAVRARTGRDKLGLQGGRRVTRFGCRPGRDLGSLERGRYRQAWRR